MYPPLFGPMIWDTMLLLAMSYPETPNDQYQKLMKDFLTSLCHLLPCPGCSNHAVEYLNTHPINLSSKQTVTQWVVDFHNAVNIRLGKATYTVDEAKKALIKRIDGDMKDLSRALQIRKEDSQRIIQLQSQLHALLTNKPLDQPINVQALSDELNNTNTSTNDIWMWVAISFMILSFILIIGIIIAAKRKK